MTVPEKLGKYYVLGEIGRGSMGTVYSGHDPYTDRSVALKVAHTEMLNDEELGEQHRKMFFNEAKIAGGLDHPNIVAVHDAGTEEDYCYIIMDLITGEDTLKPYCKPDNLLPFEKVAEIIFKCAKALDYAHKQGVIHRDIKPSNILVTEDMDVMISDFGIARMHRNEATQTQQAGLVGSPQYMSPEQLKEEYVTYQTDIFSLGIVMYEMLAGKHPFVADNFSRLVYKIMHEEPPPLHSLRSDLPDQLLEIFESATKKKTEERYQTALEFAAHLSQTFGSLEFAEDNIAEQEKFGLVKNLEFFHHFPEVELWEVIHASTWQNYTADENIIIEGEIDDCFYIIVQGSVGVVKSDQSFRALNTGDCFGEMGYLTKTNRTATIKALTDAMLLKLNSTVMSQLSLNCQVRFLKVFLKTLIHRLTLTTNEILQNSTSRA